MNIPTTHNTLMPCLTLDNAEAFEGFLQSVFGGDLHYKSLREDGKSIMHAEFRIDGQTIMYSQKSEQWPVRTGDFFIYVDNADQSFQKALNAGATVIMEPADQSYGRSGGIKDPFGNSWWITSL
ncbi:VOC family protein [Flavihumibacter petaseus]|uniref:VOC domain-containing protein n=1 Tax=Flavihumibacter petaseus NBRC 106054 TaxID=1220578 RepID=A0A0E9MUL3_9BACT|nr:VOC family protein [Flavihumibacter petaseus]GAO41264.1 hypothetical protein FPE01S_01_02760 [Flavihumibacter petaseus NBRC 106054]